MKVWIDGEISEAADARIPVTDHGLLYGDGVFEGMRVHAGRVFGFEHYLARITTALKAIHLSVPGGVDALRKAVESTIAAYGQSEAYVRLLVTRGDGPLGVDPTRCGTPRVICMVGELQVFSKEALSQGIALRTSSLRRPPADALDPRVKSLNYLNNVLAKHEARAAGADEALLLNHRGLVAEASVANLFIVRDGALATPRTSDGALGGVTRRTVLELAGELGIEALACGLSRFDVLGADEAFLTGSGAGVVPVRSLDGERIGYSVPGPMTQQISTAFSARLARS